MLNQKPHQRVAEFIKEIKSESPEWVKDRRKDYLLNKQKETQNQLAKDRLFLGRAILKGKEELFIQKHIEKGEKELKKIEVLLGLLDAPEGELTYHEIAQAKEYPLHELLGKKPGQKVKCPFHEPDLHPSLHLYKSGTAHCFSCKESTDSIRYLMATAGIGFIDAVKKLNHA